MNKLSLAIVTLLAVTANALPGGRFGPVPEGETIETTLEDVVPIVKISEQIIVEPLIPGFRAANEIVHCKTGEVIPVDAASIDINGCLVGPCGERVCSTGTFGAGNDRTTFRGNAGPGLTGSNGNAGPITAAGLPVDPAAQTYLKQIEAYKRWEKQQEENNKRIIG